MSNFSALAILALGWLTQVDPLVWGHILACDDSTLDKLQFIMVQ